MIINVSSCLQRNQQNLCWRLVQITEKNYIDLVKELWIQLVIRLDSELMIWTLWINSCCGKIQKKNYSRKEVKIVLESRMPIFLILMRNFSILENSVKKWPWLNMVLQFTWQWDVCVCTVLWYLANFFLYVASPLAKASCRDSC